MLIEQMTAEWIVYCMLYGGVAFSALIASIYLCIRRGNAFAPDITPPVHLRRWAAAFCAVAFLGHVWWYLFYTFSGDMYSVSCLVVGVIDCMSLLTTIFGTLLAMLQDRKRPVWPFVLSIIPYIVFLTLNIFYPDGHFIYIGIGYNLAIYMFFSIFMVFAIRQYGRWLRDNYADLEHKEVWMSHVLIIVILLLIIIYGFDLGNLVIGYIMQLNCLALIIFLLWRVETLPQLETIESTLIEQQEEQPEQLSIAITNSIEQLLAERCVDTQLYLQQDLTLQQLAMAIGTNRTYLSQYFASRGLTYNAYINGLRVDHFMNLYRETIAARKSIAAQQLCNDCGFKSYSTFSLAFKQRTGQSVSSWMHETI